MQRENWLAVAAAIETYDDAVMQAAQRAVPVLLSADSYDYDFTELRAALAADEENIGRDYKRACWAHDAFASAIEQYEDECHWDAARALIHAMLTRSYSWEQSFC
jgi:hypothetical protein